MADVKIIQGEIFRDARGAVSTLNDFRFDGVNRVYFLHHPDTTTVRGWNAHKFEKKWFYCVHGAFTVALVEIDDFEQPAKNLQPQIFHLDENNSQIICVPEGYASAMRAETPNSVLQVFSGKILSEATTGNYRYEANYWFNWNEVK